MRKFILGILVGMSLTYGVTSLAQNEGPKLVGKDGRLHNYEVRDVNGKRVCYDPFVLVDGGLISCDK